MHKQSSLQHITALVTRPIQQASHLAQQIIALGGDAILFPTLEIADIADKTHLINVCAKLAQFQIAIFVSANAVEKTMPYWPKKISTTKIVAIGAATAAALLSFNIDVELMPEGQWQSHYCKQ